MLSIPSNRLGLRAPVLIVVGTIAFFRPRKVPGLLVCCIVDSLSDIGLGMGLALLCPGEACRVCILLGMIGVAAEVRAGCKDMVCTAGMACVICGGAG